MIAAFGTGIASFEIIDISEDQMISHIPQKGRKELRAKLDKTVAYMRENLEVEECNIIMRTKRDLFIVSFGRYEEVTCKTIKFSHIYGD